MKQSLNIAFACCILLINACGNEDATNVSSKSAAGNNTTIVEKGTALFNTNCKLCHAIAPNEGTGLAPVLDSIKSHWPNADELQAYIKNAPEEMQSTARSRFVYQQWKDKSQMPPYLGLSQADVAAIVAYLYDAAP